METEKHDVPERVKKILGDALYPSPLTLAVSAWLADEITPEQFSKLIQQEVNRREIELLSSDF